MRPDAHEGLLCDVLSFGGVAEDAAGNPKHGRQMTAREHLECPFVATRDPGHKRFVAVIHRNVAAAMGNARPF